MRYIVFKETLDKHHPRDPNREVFRLLDRIKGQNSLAYWTSYDSAKALAERKNLHED